MATLAPFFAPQFFNDSGEFAAGYKLYTYDSGTTTPKVTYSDQAGTIPNTNPIVLDAAGKCSLWLGTGEYTLALKTPADALVDSWDDVGGVPAATADEFLPLAGGETMTGLFELSGNATAALNPTPLQQVNAMIAAAAASLTSSLGSQTPIGTIALWLTGSPSANWLKLNGNNVSRTTYATLFALWGTAFGVGDGSTTFGLPDTRGEFPRFWDDSRGVDSGRAIGSAQTDLVKTHTHGVVVGRAIADGNVTSAGGGLMAFAETFPATETSDTGGTTTGAENRPRNFALMAIVRAL